MRVASIIGRKEGSLALGEVRLELPASPDYFRLARIMVAGVASRGGFTLDALEDLRLAIDELCFALVGGGREGTLTLTLRLVPQGVEVDGSGRFVDVSPARTLSPLSEMILGTVVDDFEVTFDGEQPRFRLVKLLAAPG